MSSPVLNGTSPRRLAQSASLPSLTEPAVSEISSLDSPPLDNFDPVNEINGELHVPRSLATPRAIQRASTDIDAIRLRLDGGASPRPSTGRSMSQTPQIARAQWHAATKKIITSLKVFRAFSATLCEVCQKLQLNQEKFIIQDHSSDPNQQAYRSFLQTDPTKEAVTYPQGAGSGKFRLGTLEDIWVRSSECTFCRLVKDSLSVFHAKELSNDRAKYENAKCFAIWQVDGREVKRDDHGNVKWSRPRTRRIQLRWDSKDLEDSYLVLIAPEPINRHDFDPQAPWESNTMFLGRNITSAGNNQALAKKWLDMCNEHHGVHCNFERGPDFEEMISGAFFGVIDVHEMKLTALPQGESYVALSYVWGRYEHEYRTKLNNIQLRQNPGELGKIIQNFPKVAQDAIELVRSLGLKYIWIDSLCIVQDSGKSWKLNSSVMDLVYGNAHLTICAADGEDAYEGLKGISKDRIVEQHIEKVCKNVRLMVSHLAETYVEKSKWNSRAWTFQERLLAKRCLIFAGTRMFFQCRSAAMSEDIVAEQPDAGWSIELVQAPLQLLQGLSTRAFQIYMQCVRLYTARELTGPEDILAAFMGMSNLLGKKLESPLVFGLPSSHFDLALLWEPVKKCHRRIVPDKDVRHKDSRTTFPSWSWCGWDGSAMEYRKETIAGCLEDVRQWHAQHTWINWYIRDSKGNLRLIWDHSKNGPRDPSLRTQKNWMGYVNQKPDGTMHPDPFGREVSEEISKQTRDEFKRTLPEYPYKISITRKVSTGEADQQQLQFWTWSAYLRVNPHEQSDYTHVGDGLDRYDILDYTGDWCGTIVLDEPWTASAGSEHEFIAISEAKQFSKEENDNWSYYIPQDRDQSDWSLYFVLLIKRERGIARRVGLGKVFKDAFNNSCLPGKDWREIIME